jgi:hypothetical protein
VRQQKQTPTEGVQNMSVKTSAKLLAVAVIVAASSPAFARQEAYGHSFGQRAGTCRQAPFEACAHGENRMPHWTVPQSTADDWPHDLILD